MTITLPTQETAGNMLEIFFGEHFCYRAILAWNSKILKISLTNDRVTYYFDDVTKNSPDQPNPQETAGNKLEIFFGENFCYRVILAWNCKILKISLTNDRVTYYFDCVTKNSPDQNLKFVQRVDH